MNRILVIGGTGNIGNKLISQLTATGTDIRMMVRDPQIIETSSQVEVCFGDLTLPGTLSNPLEAVEAVFLIWTAPAEAVVPALRLITGRVKRIVYLSAPIKTLHPFFQASLPNPMSLLHEKIEQLIISSGIEYTILRPGMLASNAVDWWAPQIRKGNLVRWPYLYAPTAPIDELDIASVAVATLLENHHQAAEYILTGPQSLSQFEQVSIIGQAIGMELNIEEIPPEEAYNSWNATWPAFIKNMLLKSWAAAIGQPAFVSKTVEEITGASARTFREWAYYNATIFQP